MIKIKVDTGNGTYEYLELLPNLSFEKTNQFYKFSEIEYGRSVSFNIPRTSTNEKVLQDTGQVYEYGQLMRKEIPCRVQYGAIEKYGKLTIESANEKNYSCTLYTEISLLLDWVNGRKLKEYGADWTVFWNYAHAHAANDQGLTSKVMGIIPYSSEVPQNYIAKDEWCWLPSINIGKAISLLLGKAQSVTGDYNTRTYDLFDEVPKSKRNLYWLVLNSNNGSGSHSVNFRMQNNIPIVPMGDLGELEFELYSAYNESFLNGQRYAWVCDKDIVITVPQDFPAGIMLCSVHKIKGNIHTWLNEDPLTWYVNLKNFWAASTHVPGNQTLLPGDRIRITAGTHFAFYALSDLYWSSDDRMHVFSQNLQGGNYQLTLELEFKEDIPLMPSQSSQSNLYHFADNAPDMTLMDLCKMYGMLTNTVFTFEDHELRFLKDAGFHDVEITDCTYFSEVKRLVGDWAIDEKICFDSDDYVEQPISTTYHIDNLAVDQNENEHKLNASEGFLRSHGSYFGDGMFIPPAKRLAIHDASVEYEDDNTTIKKIKLDMKKPVVASLQTGNVRTLKRISKLPDNPYYSDLCEFSTKVKAKWRMSIEDFIKLDHTYRFVYRGRKYIWLDAKWNNGIVECTLQLSDYTAVEEYYINVTYTNGGDAGTSGYAQLGDTYYIWARPADGFTFDHWECNGVTVSGAGQDYSFTVDGDAEWHAVFLGDEVTITATPDPLTAGTCTGGGTYHCGEMCTVTAAPAGVQYRFVEWQENGQQVSTSASYTFLVTGDRDLVAVFETLEKYSVVATCSPQGVATVSGSGSYYDGTTCTVAVTTNQRAFAFLHWVDLDTDEVVSTSTSYTFVVHSDRNLQAVYYGGHTVTTSTSPVGAGNTYGDGFYNEGDQVTVGFTPDQRNFTFDHWEDGDNPGVSVSSNNPYTFTIHEDRWLVAKCTGSTPTFYVNCSVDPTGAGTVSGTGQYVAGETCTLAATPAEGYHFSYYNELYGIFNTTDNPYTFTVSQNIVATAYFAKNLYRITVLADPTSGGTVTGGSGTGYYQYGQSVTITATANTGYDFLGWYLNGSLVTTQSSYTFTVTETATYIARFSNTKYNIIATVSPSNAGTVNGVGSFYYGENCTLTAVPVHGYSFSHWEEGGLNAGTSNPYTFTVTGNRSLVAVMEALEKRSLAAFPIPEKAGTCVVQSAPFFDGDTAYFNAIPNTGSTFSHWSTSNTGSPIISTLNPYPQTVSGDLTLYGMFDWNTYTVNVSLSPTGHGSVTGSGTYTYGDGCTCVATLTDDYIVDRWEVDGVTIQNGGNTFTFAVSGNNSVVCYVVQGTFYTVSAVTNPRSLGTITGAGSYLAGTNCTLSIDVAQGYSFHHWEKDGNNIGTGTSVTFQVNGNTYVTAEGSQIQYYINAVSSPLNCGTFTGTGAYTYGSQVILRAIPNQGYEFDSWWENNAQLSTSPEITFLATQDRTLYARFNALSQYTISTVSVPNAGGSVSGAGTYYGGSICTLEARSNGKYYFDHWSTSMGGASISTSNPYSFTVDSNATLYATFYEYAYTITTEVSPAGGGTVTGGGSYTVDSRCTLTATPSTGYVFDHWEDENGNIVGRNPQYTINQVERAATLVAVFNQSSEETP